MGKVMVRIGVVVAASAALVLTSTSLAPASSAAKATGPETISGTVHGKAATASVPHIRLTCAGCGVRRR